MQRAFKGYSWRISTNLHKKRSLLHKYTFARKQLCTGWVVFILYICFLIIIIIFLASMLAVTLTPISDFFVSFMFYIKLFYVLVFSLTITLALGRNFFLIIFSSCSYHFLLSMLPLTFTLCRSFFSYFFVFFLFLLFLIITFLRFIIIITPNLFLRS